MRQFIVDATLVCTIGPASDSPDMLEKMIKAGLNVARLNFSHGNFDTHGEIIRKIRAASKATGKRDAIMADLPGPKIRIKDFEKESVLLEKGAHFTLTARNVTGASYLCRPHPRRSADKTTLPSHVMPQHPDPGKPSCKVPG